MDNKYEWKYCSLGGAIRVNVSSGEDIAHLGELDRKLWTVLSCPVDSLEFDRRTLDCIDTDADGCIKVDEVIAAAQWLTSVIKDKDSILKGESSLDVNNIDTSTERGRRLCDSARRILSDLGREGDVITLDEASDSAAIFAGTKLNGDGLITVATADDAALKKVISEIIARIGSGTDRSGDPGVGAQQIETFYKECADYAAWMSAADADRNNVFPYGEDTAAAYAACNALKDKMSDFFTRCRLLRYDAGTAVAVAVSVDDISQIAACPIARPDAGGILPFDDVNPAWQAQFDTLRSLVPAMRLEGAKGVSESEWNAVLAGFSAYASWLASKKGEAVESLGIDEVRSILASGSREALLSLVAADLALKEEADSTDEVKKLMLLYRDFYHLLRNYVIFTDFYSREQGARAMFEAGRLYIDQRCCELCIKVSDMSQHADMARLSGMFLIYCICTSKELGKSMDIVAVLTAGEIAALRPGKNGIFYDREGRGWDAVVTRVVDNPISISQAFWAPYRKFWDFCVGLLNKSAADKDSKVTADIQARIAAAASAPTSDASADSSKKPVFDIAKFAGIFAALGMALGYIGSALTKIVSGIAANPDGTLAAVAVIILLISGPSCFLAWSKLRRRNLGPVLNANGWAINSNVLVNILFGSKLTGVAKYPRLKLSDPYRKEPPAWRKWVLVIVLVIAVAFALLYVTGKMDIFVSLFQ